MDNLDFGKIFVVHNVINSFFLFKKFRNLPFFATLLSPHSLGIAPVRMENNAPLMSFSVTIPS